MDLRGDSRHALAKLETRIKSGDVLPSSVSIKAQVAAIRLVVEKLLAPIVSRIDSMEIKTLVPLKDGEPGRDGLRGPPGKDGLRGPPGNNGTNGSNGSNGAKGKDGTHGVSVIDAEVAADDHLVLHLSDGEIIDAGPLPGTGADKVLHTTQLAGNQVTVSATAPGSPFVGQLWYDIS